MGSYSGAYVVFEGLDGCGKSSLMREVANTLSSITTRTIIQTSHPGSTALGAEIRKILKSEKAYEMDKKTRQMLYLADHNHFVNSILIDSLESGNIVLSDRHSCISSIAYSTAEGILDSDLLNLLNVSRTPMVDKCFILDIDIQSSKKRINARSGELDYYDDQKSSFFENVRKNYQNMRNFGISCKFADPKDIVYLEASSSIDDLCSEVIDYLEDSL